ncbi:DUF2953 domain-containing protein [Lederbergia citri]|uniref:DUF2953 domain-containing protein n=1 Tax=Lederbergia citri TaxID=2833580 RepID=A0A942TF00_9BACI|nr:DUF2953 domain-containing protein [Lederbergia citri]MBS4195007.1 DUF2953 domain-containing protein [Lederbergia citri]
MTLPVTYGLLLLLLLLTLVIIFMKIKIELFILFSKSERYTTITITTFFGLVRIKKKFSMDELWSKEAKEEINDHIDDLTSMKSMLKDAKPFLHILYSFLQKMRIRKFEWHTKIGTGDAAFSGTVAGAIWGIKGAILSLIRSVFLFKTRPIISVVPEFQGFAAETNMRCMVDIKTGKAMVAGYKLYKEWKKHQKSSFLERQNQRLNRRSING